MDNFIGTYINFDFRIIMKLKEYLDIDQLHEMIIAKMVMVNYHPNGYLRILTYSKECQEEHIWNDTTEKCRGLIVDGDNNILARPFKKFYNYEELIADGFPIDKYLDENMAFDAYDKLDGSLGILYWINDTPYIATRGSFTSEQALHATELLHTKYRNIWDKLDRNKTFLFEIIYPEDLHVITYKGVDDIFLIGVLDTEDENTEYDIESYSHLFNTTKKYTGVKNWRTLREQIDGTNREGFVIRFADGFRMKLKYEDYWTLHYLKSGFSEKNIYNALKNEDYTYIKDAMKLFDEEHKLHYEKIMNKYKSLYRNILKVAASELRDDFATRKEAAEYFKTCTYPAVMFCMYDCTRIPSAIWKYVDQIVKFPEDNNKVV